MTSVVAGGAILTYIVVKNVRRPGIKQRKTAQLSEFAKAKDWRYAEEDRSLGGPWGGNGGGEHVLTGGYRDRQIIAYEYIARSSGTGEHGGSTTYTVATMSTPASRSTLEVSREGVGRKLLGLAGLRDLQIGDEEFDKTFRIKTDDETFAREVLHVEMVQWLLADGRALTMPFRFQHGDLTTWEKADIDTPNVMRMLGFIGEVFERVPNVVWKS